MDLAFELLTDLEAGEIKKMSRQLKEASVNPRDIKARLAREVVAVFHEKRAAQKAEEEFRLVFKERQLPSDMPCFEIKSGEINILDLFVKTKLAVSKSEAKRLLEQGAVTVGDEILKDWQLKVMIKKGLIIKAGKRKFARII